MTKILNKITEKRDDLLKNERYLLKNPKEYKNGSVGDIAAFFASSDDTFHANYLYECDIEQSKKELLRKEQLLTAGALIVAELQRLDKEECELMCFLKYM